MKAFEVFAIYVAPFLIIGAAIKLFMKRYAVDLPDVQKKCGLQAEAQISARSLAYRRIRRPLVLWPLAFPMSRTAPLRRLY
jgi:hypothetical protein